jgi:DNA-binding transcriptional ArsR family regulator
MVFHSSATLDGVFHALADPTRRGTLRSLAKGDRNIGELAAPNRMSLAAASKHVRVLESAGLVRRRIQGRTRICRIEPSPLAKAEEWLRFYDGSGRKDSMLSMLAPEGSGSLLTVIHESLPSSHVRETERGWSDMFTALASILDGNAAYRV